jgi:UDP-hydrolysing UDP-N-acetyl-D-glucosamine 2-epimerase
VLGFTSSLGDLMVKFCQTIKEITPDLLILTGDRMELLPVASAAICLGIPIAHISGGEITEGAIDDSVRHAVTKLSHLHFASNAQHAKRLIQMGEEPWRVTTTGEPALDAIDELQPLSREELEQHIGIKLESPLVIVTYHPETLGNGDVEDFTNILEAIAQTPATYVFTFPNTDPGSAAIIEKLHHYSSKIKKSAICQSLGQQRYYSLMGIAEAMLGNSSSGLWEAPSFKLPVINVGYRQGRRLRAENVIDIPRPTPHSVVQGLEKALSPDFKHSLRHISNPYKMGNAVCNILQVIRQLPSRKKLLNKKFIDDPPS